MDIDQLKELQELQKRLENKREPVFSPRLKRMLREDRPQRSRLLTAAMVSFLFSFTFLLFGPLDLYMGNIDFLSFALGDIAWAILLVAAAVFVFLTGILLLLRGWLYDFAVSVLFGLTVIGYLQGNALNSHLGSLDGVQIAWEKYAVRTILNLLLWAAAILLPLLVRYFSRTVWTKAVRILCGALAGLQVVVLVFLFITVKFPNKNGGYLSNDEMFELSENDNIVVFLLDRFDNKYIDQVLASDPDYLEPLSGFTYYRNMVGSYSRTYPSIPYLLTGQRTDYSQPYQEFAKEAYEKSTFLTDLKAMNYDIRLLIQVLNAAVDPLNLEDIADNLNIEKKSVDAFSLTGGMLRLSAYRYSPFALKPSFWMYTGDMDDMMHVEGDGEYVLDDARYYNKLMQEGLNTDGDKNNFTVYHLNGAHDPYTIDENAQTIEKGKKGDVVRQSKGALKIVYDYIDQMKELGIFEQSTVIVMTDHGETYWKRELPESTNPIFFIKRAGETDAEAMKISNAPVSHEDFQATVIASAGGDPVPYGTPVWEWAEDAPRERIFWMSGASNVTRDGYLRKYKIVGDANDFGNWSLISEDKIKYPFYKY